MCGPHALWYIHLSCNVTEASGILWEFCFTHRLPCIYPGHSERGKHEGPVSSEDPIPWWWAGLRSISQSYKETHNKNVGIVFYLIMLGTLFGSHILNGLTLTHTRSLECSQPYHLCYSTIKSTWAERCTHTCAPNSHERLHQSHTSESPGNASSFWAQLRRLSLGTSWQKWRGIGCRDSVGLAFQAYWFWSRNARYAPYTHRGRRWSARFTSWWPDVCFCDACQRCHTTRVSNQFRRREWRTRLRTSRLGPTNKGRESIRRQKDPG